MDIEQMGDFLWALYEKQMAGFSDTEQIGVCSITEIFDTIVDEFLTKVKFDADSV